VPGIFAVGNRPLARSIGREGPAGTIGVERLRMLCVHTMAGRKPTHVPTSTSAPCLRTGIGRTLTPAPDDDWALGFIWDAEHTIGDPFSLRKMRIVTSNRTRVTPAFPIGMASSLDFTASASVGSSC
jgi:hypothetical protein